MTTETQTIIAALSSAAKRDAVSYDAIARSLGLAREVVASAARNYQSLWLR